jgi:hypothetical protein
MKENIPPQLIASTSSGLDEEKESSGYVEPPPTMKNAVLGSKATVPRELGVNEIFTFNNNQWQ